MNPFLPKRLSIQLMLTPSQHRTPSLPRTRPMIKQRALLSIKAPLKGHDAYLGYCERVKVTNITRTETGERQKEQLILKNSSTLKRLRTQKRQAGLDIVPKFERSKEGERQGESRGWQLLNSVQQKLIREFKICATKKQPKNVQRRGKYQNNNQTPCPEVHFSDIFYIKKADQTRNSLNKSANCRRPLDWRSSTGCQFNRKCIVFRESRGEAAQTRQGPAQQQSISLKRLIHAREPWSGTPSSLEQFISFSPDDCGWETVPEG